jgi:hypothetical protein
MKFLSLLIATILLTIAPCWADAQSSLFRHAFFCPDRGPSSVCIFGTIPSGRQVTLLAKEWRSPAAPKEVFPNTDFDNGFKTITRLQVAAPPPKDAFMIAVVAAADAANPIPLKEVQDDALVARIALHIKKAQELNLDPDIRLLRTRLLRLSPTILLSETYLAPPGEAAALEKELSTGCRDCENVPMLVGQSLTDLFAETRSHSVNAVESTCGGIKFAFALSGRTYLVSYAESCGGDSLSATLIHDLSGKQPKLVFK